MDDYVKTYSSMKPKEAAAIFDTMTDNLQLVADIFLIWTRSPEEIFSVNELGYGSKSN